MFLPVTLELLTGFWETLKIFFLTLLFSIPLGLVVCFGSMSGFKPLRWLTRGIIWVIRGTPLMLQLIVVFYAPGLMFSLSSEEYGIGFRKDSDVTAKVNELLAKYKADGTLQALADKYSLTLA